MLSPLARSTRVALAALALAALVLATALPAAARRAKPKSMVVLKARKVGGRTIAVTAGGFTVYHLKGDRRGEGCTGACRQVWPIVVAPANVKLVGGRGVRGKIGAVTRPDGRRQLTFRGHPLYRYNLDSRPGQARGNGAAGVWFVLGAS